MTSLSKTILECQEDRGDWNEAIQRVSEIVYTFAAGRKDLGEEDSAEFLLYFYPRMRHLMERYKPIGSSFEAYLHTTLRWQVRTFAKSRGNSKIKLVTAEATGAIEGAHGDSVRECMGQEPCSTKPVADQRRRRNELATNPAPRRACSVGLQPRRRQSEGGLSPGEAQRILMLALKGCERLDETRCAVLAEELGVDPQWMIAAWLRLRSECSEQRERRNKACTTRDRAWFQLRCIEAQMKQARSEEDVESLSKRAAYWRRTYENARERAQKMTVSPTHKQIAETLGIPKGTVDSSVFKARRELQTDAYLGRLARIFDYP